MIVGMSLESFIGVSWSRPLSAAASPASAASSVRAASPASVSRFALADMIGHYKRSKFLAEQVARDAARAGGSVVIVNPS